MIPKSSDMLFAPGYPVLFARASLKPFVRERGQIGADTGYPVLFARASLKPAANWIDGYGAKVIPCFLRGPH